MKGDDSLNTERAQLREYAFIALLVAPIVRCMLVFLTMVGPPTYPAPRHVSEYSKSLALPMLLVDFVAGVAADMLCNASECGSAGAGGRLAVEAADEDTGRS